MPITAKFNKILVGIALSTTIAACSATEKTTSIDAPTVAPLISLYDYQLVDSKAKAPVSLVSVVNSLKNTDVVFIGEFHSHQASHRLQLQLLASLYQDNPNIVLSMEQFTRDAQPIVDKYLSNEYGEATLLSEGNAWDHYKGSYRAIVEFARESNIPIIAANAPAMHVRCVGRKGVEVLANLPENEVNWSAKKLDLDNKKYQGKFFEFMKHAGRSHGLSAEDQQKRQMNTYAAQLLRDTTMAESIAMAMDKYPGAKIVHLNGSFHSDSHLGTAAVLEDMIPKLVTTVLSPVSVEDGNAINIQQQPFEQGDYLYLLKQLPERYIDKDMRNKSIRKLIKKRMTEKCTL